MKKIFIMMILCMGVGQAVQAQTWDEWFKQRKTQRKYLLQQIAALKVYIEYARKGYKIIGDGLNLIGKIKNGDFNIHEEFFSSLRLVNPKIRNYVKVASTITLQSRIIKETGKALRAMRESGQFTPVEISYSEKVIERLLLDCLDCINQLYIVITANEFEMKDGERIKYIDKLYADMQDKYSFCASYNEETGILTMQRKMEAIEVDYSKIINREP